MPGKCDSRTDRSVERLVTAHDACGTFQNEEMLVLILMNMHRRAVARMREYFDDRIGTVRLRGRHTYEATLSRPRLQPLALVRRTGSVGVRCHCCCAFPSSCVWASRNVVPGIGSAGERGVPLGQSATQ